MIEPLTIEGELIITEDGSVMLGSQELGSMLYEWCNGRCDNVRITVEDISDE